MTLNYCDKETQTETVTILEPREDVRKLEPKPEKPTELPFAEHNLPIELIDKILLDIPMRDLLLAQRVSKSWVAFINWSTPCQQKLFFTATKPKSRIPPGHSEDEYEHSCYGDSCCSPRVVDVNPLLVNAIEGQPRRFHIPVKLKHLGAEASCSRMRLVSAPIRGLQLLRSHDCEDWQIDDVEDITWLEGDVGFGRLLQDVQAAMHDILTCMTKHWTDRRPRDYILHYEIDKSVDIVSA